MIMDMSAPKHCGWCEGMHYTEWCPLMNKNEITPDTDLETERAIVVVKKSFFDHLDSHGQCREAWWTEIGKPIDWNNLCSVSLALYKEWWDLEEKLQ